jgi:hypothetical protein
MSEVFSFASNFQTVPSGGSSCCSDGPDTNESINFRALLASHQSKAVQLTSDSSFAVGFDGTIANVLIIQSDQRILASYTSTLVASQVIPVDPFNIIVSRTAPFSALVLTRQPGILTNVRIFMGQIA